jgi:hypothetical protein
MQKKTYSPDTKLKAVFRLLGPNPTRTLVANSEIRSIDRQQVLETPGCQLGQHSENEFATSINKCAIRGNKRGWARPDVKRIVHSLLGLCTIV